MLSMRWVTVIVIVAVIAAAMGLVTERNVESSVMLAGVAAILAFLTVTVLLLAEIVDAVQAAGRNHGDKHSAESRARYDDAVNGERPAHRLRMAIAIFELVSSSKIRHGNTTSGILIGKSGALSGTRALGNHIDIVIPSDRKN